MPPIIEVKNLVKRYRKSKINAVDDISFSVGEGEFFALLGPNGAGKTTTISILNTTLIKTSGQARLCGFDIEKQAGEVRQRIGVIFQNPSLDRNLTAEENVRFHASLYGLYPFRPIFSLMSNSYKEKVFELAELMGIRQEIFQPIITFSGGMKRKLEIIRGLMHNPRVLFLDEPTTGLDPASRRNVWEYLQNVRRKESTTIFLTTHYLEEAESADHIAIINKGKLISYGTPEEIKKDLKIQTPTLEEAYLEIIKNHDN
ncbi:MAG: ABC transporter ATP-binding protein [Candidatus Portnoybacteria bacterium RIFCSPLOWO2_01_FULL_43_11]|uniref:ABC transporter ATP-binding protein n=3 Tax=Bacteria candidate phyla TaxID=1783234 RepID=A0A1G2FP02_9BACT|nr:MAG: ABC transporter ATP-binding protein [candidate division WWE3 bacterium RIFCSPHIGHO2_01_FULL_35_17]OGZ36537.1 MAG: ABC transporter ATP-binding protein [Candidatus Portnoybacteria bacterium RIFCSPHIGHO2_02_FULL_40_23]OGZ39061.1 MAG: ABC transporter ATP-binding protein [Candidatus Portnoybacteria bacterium RIFCSPLOWO2_01_FULL_43_11]OGZ39338.1 MAG: ABC transporter ATP-binding protein [Candidatus Portnoybacteria bacterium RIFCSPHIGHO2_12_FULL_40_11]